MRVLPKYEALEFCNKLSLRQGLTPVYLIKGRTPPEGYPAINATVVAQWGNNGYRLPTEAEWEYAAKGGDGSPGDYIFSGANDAAAVAWYFENSESRPHPVGLKEPNGLGLYDMTGNVWEWCWGWDGAYDTEDKVNPKTDHVWVRRMTRGGSWTNPVTRTRSTRREGGDPTKRSYHIGFRVVRN